MSTYKELVAMGISYMPEASSGLFLFKETCKTYKSTYRWPFYVTVQPLQLWISVLAVENTDRV